MRKTKNILLLALGVIAFSGVASAQTFPIKPTVSKVHAGTGVTVTGTQQDPIVNAIGGSGSPGGPANSLQTNDGAGGFAGSANLTYDGNLEVSGSNMALDDNFGLYFNSISDPNWKVGLNLAAGGAYTRNFVTGDTVDHSFGSSSGNGETFGTSGGSAILELDGSGGSAYFNGKVAVQLDTGVGLSAVSKGITLPAGENSSITWDYLNDTSAQISYESISGGLISNSTGSEQGQLNFYVTGVSGPALYMQPTSDGSGMIQIASNTPGFAFGSNVAIKGAELQLYGGDNITFKVENDSSTNVTATGMYAELTNNVTGNETSEWTVYGLYDGGGVTLFDTKIVYYPGLGQASSWFGSGYTSFPNDLIIPDIYLQGQLSFNHQNDDSNFLNYAWIDGNTVSTTPTMESAQFVFETMINGSPSDVMELGVNGILLQNQAADMNLTALVGNIFVTSNLGTVTVQDGAGSQFALDNGGDATVTASAGDVLLSSTSITGTVHIDTSFGHALEALANGSLILNGQNGATGQLDSAAGTVNIGPSASAINVGNLTSGTNTQVQGDSVFIQGTTTTDIGGFGTPVTIHGYPLQLASSGTGAAFTMDSSGKMAAGTTDFTVTDTSNNVFFHIDPAGNTTLQTGSSSGTGDINLNAKHSISLTSFNGITLDANSGNTIQMTVPSGGTLIFSPGTSGTIGFFGATPSVQCTQTITNVGLAACLTSLGLMHP